MDVLLDIEIHPQPTETTCGPTCLASVYEYWGQSFNNSELLENIDQLDGGGTLAVQLACDALHRGYDATIVTYNLQLFDPTWFDSEGSSIPAAELTSKLAAQLKAKSRLKDAELHRLEIATDAYSRFLSLGGRVVSRPLNGELLQQALNDDVPILCGLSATYLYQEPRERIEAQGPLSKGIDDDIAGEPQGHFVILHGYSTERNTVRVADPLQPNPVAKDGYYETSFTRVASAILLGILTYDANLLLIKPRVS